MNEQFPDFFLRGLSNKDFVCDGLVLQSAFQFDDCKRDDNMHEASINWLDDSRAIDIALSQRKENGKLQFQAGVAKLDLNMVKLFLAAIQNSTFTYERAAIDGNPYHGNLLIHGNTPKQIKGLIANGLALAAGTNIIPQTNT